MASFLFIRWFSMIMCKIGQDIPLESVQKSESGTGMDANEKRWEEVRL